MALASLIWLLFNFLLASGSTHVDCPSACFCDSKNAEQIPGGVGLKINCHPTLGASDTFNIKLPSNTIQLDLAKYGLREIKSDTFSGLVYLQKLDLQGNSRSRLSFKRSMHCRYVFRFQVTKST